MENQSATFDWRFYFGLFTLMIALLGAGLGIYNTWLKDRIKIKVKLEFGSTFPIMTDSRPDILLTAENHSLNRTVILDTYGFYVKGIKEVISFDHFGRLPYELRAGTKLSLTIRDHTIFLAIYEEGIKTDTKITGFYKDQLGNEFKSKPLLFEMLNRLTSRAKSPEVFKLFPED